MSENLRCAETLKRHGQEHLLQYWGVLRADERKDFIAQLTRFDFADTADAFQKSQINNNVLLTSSPENVLPVPKDRYGCVNDMSKEEIAGYWNAGLKAIAHGQVGVILLAGGQGTRLGVSYPKGMYDVGLISGKKLYQLQAERIRRLEKLANEAYPDKNGRITWYIMTSEATDVLTEEFFAEHSYFGLNQDQIRFFEQGVMPCFEFDGKIIMETRSRIAVAPDGNGGLYKALVNNDVLADISKRGVLYLHVYCVDNILVRMADPTFLGFSITRNADCCNKVVEKTDPKEPVGVVCWVDGVAQVVEYSEILPEMAERREKDNGTGRLTFRAGNIANHFFTTEFLKDICLNQEKKLRHHVAKKKIPYVCQSAGDVELKTVHPTAPNGIKLEKFVFDVFQFAKNFHVYEVPRAAEFSPLKNATGVDSPDTCRHDLFALHKQWFLAAGGKIADNALNDFRCEVSPLISYEGENLTQLVNGKTFSKPIYLDSDGNASNGCNKY